jgi:uncharacterized protein YbjT (DUF2867 family)
MTRNPDSDAAKEMSKLGAEIVQADLNDADSLVRAMDGAWGVFAVQNTWEAGVEGEEEQGKRQAELAREHGIKHYVYGSVQSADRDTGIPHFDNKARVEQTVRDAGFPSYTILRPVFFMENWLSPWFKPALEEGKVAIGSKPDTKLQQTAVADIGKYGKLAFEEHEKLNGEAIGIAGDELTMNEVTEIFSKVTGRDLEFYQVPIDQIREMSEDFAIMLEWFDEVGYNVDIEANARKYGIEPTRFEEWAKRQDL